MLFAILACFVGCTGNKTSSESAGAVSSITLAQTPQVPVQNKTDSSATYDTLAEDDDDCVFNNDFKGLTTKWLNELKIKDFIWRDDLKGALVPLGEDTVLLSQGGCRLFGITAELRMYRETPDITDSAFWVSKALLLADQFELNDYSDVIKRHQLKLSSINKTQAWYEVYPENTIENEIFDGIVITVEGSVKKISIGKYFN